MRRTKPDKSFQQAPDLVKHKFCADRPNELCVSDFTCVPTWSGVAYIAFIINVHSRFVGGWRVSSSMTTGLAADALEMAVSIGARASSATSYEFRCRESRWIQLVEVPASSPSVPDSHLQRVGGQIRTQRLASLLADDHPKGGNVQPLCGAIAVSRVQCSQATE